MSDSSLISGTILSPNYTAGNFKKSGITPHYMDGYLTAAQCADIFSNPARRASSNYTIGYNGEIVLCVHEHDRSWCSGNYNNDARCVTIECANKADGSLTDSTWNSLVRLCADICKRNGFKLNYTGNTNGNLTMHKWFQDTDCPGVWLSKQFDRLAREVNSMIDGGINPPMVFGGTYRCTVNGLRVRDAPSLYANVITYYNAGQTVTLDDWYTSEDGYIWGRYTGASSGEKRYVAVGRDTGKVETDDYLIKI